ncbi:hypothetical protein [Spirosoma endbachense]|uniref:Uncharacterized protein n=1 Tax=Spirosoma endbachense TaxID=2666025 RepID=A0A6P1W4M3_9BACT|nr:hypothetical protein [Spirosoma endbachense]QHV98949.1 hypothetical protein GJR95_29825 [Spirosoma endbachense]
MKTSLRLILFSIGLLTGCSKSSPEPEPEFYVSATIGDKEWIANVNNSQNTPVAATISQNLVVVVAAQNADNATTALGVVFPESITLNTAVAIDPAQYLALAYSISETEGYSADPSKGGSGTLTVTRFDEAAGIVEGTFMGEAIHNKNGSRIRISNGRFRSAIYKTSVTTPPPGKR